MDELQIYLLAFRKRKALSNRFCHS